MNPRATKLYITLTAVGLSMAAASVAGAESDGFDSRIETTISDPHVVGGEPAPEGRWPDAAAVLNDGQLFCTGTLIAPDLVLTAAHCIVEGAYSVKLNATDADQPAEEIRATRTVVYPNWEWEYDVALLVLEREVDVAPRIIASGCALDGLASSDVSIVGYGSLDKWGETYTTLLHQALAKVMSADCSVGVGCNAAVMPAGEIVAGADGIDSCFGDSGGPLYLMKENGPYLIGVTSRALEDNVAPCEGGGIYVRADAVIPWIEEQSSKTLRRPACTGNDITPGDDDVTPGDDEMPDEIPDSELPDDEMPDSGGGGCTVGGSARSGTDIAFVFLCLGLLARRRTHRA